MFAGGSRDAARLARSEGAARAAQPAWVRRPKALLALLGLAAGVLVLGLAGCGGGGEETTGTTAQERAGAEAEGGAEQEGGAQGAGEGRGDSGGDSAGGGSSGGSGEQPGSEGSGSSGSGSSGSNGSGPSGSGSSGSGGSGSGDKPSAGSGGGGGGGGSGSGGGGSSGFSDRSKPFRTPGGDNSIQTFGTEAGAAQRQAASAVLESYMQARAADDGQGQCAHLANAAVRPMEELLSRSPEFEGKGCAAILAALGSRSDSSLRANTMRGPVASLRVQGDRAFALYHGRDGTDYFIPMATEGGEWKVATIAGPTELP